MMFTIPDFAIIVLALDLALYAVYEVGNTFELFIIITDPCKHPQ